MHTTCRFSLGQSSTSLAKFEHIVKQQTKEKYEVVLEESTVVSSLYRVFVMLTWGGRQCASVVRVSGQGVQRQAAASDVANFLSSKR